MKRTGLLFLLCWAVMSLMAQQLTVSSMTAAPMDISASQYERKDVNGQPCALIKVQLAAVGARFEGNVIGDTEFKTGEYWVYMSSGSQMLRIKHPNVLPLTITFQDYGIKSVQGKQTYELVLVMPQLIGQEVDDGMRYLVMSVTPAHSIVYIDGQLQQVNNGTVSRRLSMGRHTYRVEAVGYAPESGTVELGDGKKSLPVTLKSVQATLTVTCPTGGSNVYVNDQLRGTAPWTGELTAGDYLVEARLQSHRSHRQNITLKESEQRTLALPALVPITSSLDVNYQPVETEVWIDGKQLGTSPDIFRGVLVGSHQVELRKSGYTPKTVTVNIEEGKTASLIGNLEKIQTKQTTAASSSSSSSGSSSYSSGSTSSSYAGSGSSAISKFLNYDNITLGSTRMSALPGLGFTKSSSGSYYTGPSGINVYDENKDQYVDYIVTSNSEPLSAQWRNLGFDWGLSYNQCQNLMRRHGFTIKVTTSPHVETFSGRKTLKAAFDAMSPDGQLRIGFSFEFGNANGEGYSVDSRNSLEFLHIVYLGTGNTAANASSSYTSSSSGSSSYTGSGSSSISKFFPYGGITLGSTKTSELSGLGFTKSSSSNYYKAPSGFFAYDDNEDGYMDRILTSRGDGFPNNWSSLGFDWSMTYNQMVDLFKRLNFTMKVTINPHTVKSSSGRNTLEARIEATAPDGQMMIRTDFEGGNHNGEGYSVNSRNTLGFIFIYFKGVPGSRSSSSSSYSSSSYTASSSSLTMEDLIMHPAATLASNNKYQSMNDVIREIQRKQPTWNAKKKNSNSVTVDIDKAYRGLRYFGGTEGCYITFEGSGISFYSYYFDLSDSNIINTVIQDIENLGYRMVSNQNNEITFEGKNNIKRIELDLRERYFFITVWLK
mgnify:FL=1